MNICVRTHLAYRVPAKKRDISNNIVTVLKACGKPTLADVNCYCKMTLVLVLDSVASFFKLERRYIFM